MAFDTFDEGINPGGMRSKSEIRILICYLFDSVKERLSKELIVQAVQKQGLANYFETSSAFDDLATNGNLIKCVSDENEERFELSENGKTIARQLETTLAYSVKQKAYVCATRLLAQKKAERENSAEIEKCENGFKLKCKISGGNQELLSFELYAPSMEQAVIMKDSFYENTSTVYKAMLALLTKDKESVGEALEDLYGVL